MKIDESVIDHNVSLLIGEAFLWDIAVGKENNDEKVASLGYIEGIYDLAGRLKEVLKA